MHNCKVKIILLGESGVGKTCVLLRFLNNSYRPVISTVGCDRKFKDVVVIDRSNQEISCTLEIYDTAGQDRYKSISRSYYRSADGVILTYDVTNITSFIKLSSWLLELRADNPHAVCVLVGNKADLVNEHRVSVETVRKFAETEKLSYFECSALSGSGVIEVFKKISLLAIEKKLKEMEVLPATNADGEGENILAYAETDEDAIAEDDATMNLPPVVPLRGSTFSLNVLRDYKSDVITLGQDHENGNVQPTNEKRKKKCC